MTLDTPNQRTIVRWIHLIFAIPIVGYIYSSFDKLPDYVFPTRYVFLPDGPHGTLGHTLITHSGERSSTFIDLSQVEIPPYGQFRFVTVEAAQEVDHDIRHRED